MAVLLILCYLTSSIPGREWQHSLKLVAFPPAMPSQAALWVQPDRKGAVSTAKVFMAEYRERYPEAIAVLAESLEDSLQFYGFPEFDQRKLASMNVVERLFREVRRRSRVVGVFPSSEAYVRLLSCYLIEYSEDWVTERSYIRKKAIEATKARLTKAA